MTEFLIGGLAAGVVALVVGPRQGRVHDLEFVRGPDRRVELELGHRA